jgi:hypothetical protein
MTVTSEKRPVVRDRAIARALQLLISACKLAETVRVKGQPFARAESLQRLLIPSEENPRRPITTEAEFVKLTEAAKGLTPEIHVVSVARARNRAPLHSYSSTAVE